MESASRLVPCLCLVIAAAAASGCRAPASCTSSADCASGEVCIDSRCAPPSDSGARCIEADCDDGNPCNGVESCGASGCETGTRLPDGSACDADGSPLTPDFCVAGACAPSRCGDGVVDGDAGEVCDDANAINGDGCDACRFSCTTDADCDDGDECSGMETCATGSHRCVPGTSLADDTACQGTLGRCSAGVCLPRACASSADCDDADPCNGPEACTADGCAAGPAPSCDDSNACTEDRCEPRATDYCLHRLLDADSDGHAPSALGACGDDCDDASPLVYGGAADLCDGVDNDCDGMTDEGTIGTWYPDCDGDGYPPAGSVGIESCAAPAPALAGCATGGGWTTRSPDRGADCNDANPTVSPGQTMGQSTPIPGAPADRDFDYDCDGLEEQAFPSVGRCGSGCSTSAGFVGSVAPCGSTASFLGACRLIFSTCRELLTTQTQVCL